MKLKHIIFILIALILLGIVFYFLSPNFRTFLFCPPFGKTFEPHPLGGRCLPNCKGGEKYSIPTTIEYKELNIAPPTDQSYNPCHCKSGWKEVSKLSFVCEK